MTNVTQFPHLPRPPRPKAAPDLPPEKKPASFAFRMPPELKAAALALTKVRMDRPSRSGQPGCVDAVHTYSINDTLVTLATIGLEHMAEIVQSNLNRANEELPAFAELMAFFLANPLVAVAQAGDFPIGSPARTLIEDTDPKDPDDDTPAGWRRSDAALYYAGTQDQILGLTIAKGAILKALPGGSEAVPV